MSTSLTLYEIAGDLRALLDTEAMVPPEKQAEFGRELAIQLRASADKVQRTGEFVRFCDLQAEEDCEKEIQRLLQRQSNFKTVSRRVQEYVLHVIESMGTDDDGRYRELAGHTLSFYARTNPPSVDVLDEKIVPLSHKSITITFPYEVWLRAASKIELSGSAQLTQDVIGCVARASVSTSKASIRKVIDTGGEVPGADLNIGNNRLELK